MTNDQLLSEAQLFLRDGHHDHLSRAIADARNAAAVGRCRFCDGEIDRSGPAGKRREFCSPVHRTAYREREHQAALIDVVDAIDGLADALDQATARLRGARLRLSRFMRREK